MFTFGNKTHTSLFALLSIDFHSLEVDVKREQQIRQKHGSQMESTLVHSIQNGLALEFERSDSTKRLRLVLSEILSIASQINQHNDTFIKQSDLFDNGVYLEEVCDVLCIALAELPALLALQDTVETLLHVKHGPTIICWLLANSPDYFREVCTALIANGERQDEDSIGGKIRNKTLRMLCQMNPSQALMIRAKCVEFCRMPALAILLSMDTVGVGDMVAFVSGLLLGSDQAVRNWFAIFIRNGQKRKNDTQTALQILREELLKQLQNIIRMSLDSALPDAYVVQASAFLRLYSALRCIAGIKFQDDEVSSLVQLLTSRPPPTPAGVRFVSLGLCMLIACPSLIALPEHERKSVAWVQWLVKGETYFENVSGITAYFGEMLLLMAIHFHSNQLPAICDLVCATLGMKVQSRSNNMTRLKQIFTQEIFTEQVVTSHAVRVPVTPNLHAGITGFLPVHCIHQLLKSRAFAKHRVPIKNWIYRQVCSSVAPLHPVLPALIEVYVNSILVPPSSKLYDQTNTNKPLSEDEIRRVFQNSVFGSQFDTKAKLINRNSGFQNCEKSDEDDEYSEPVSNLKPSLTSQLLLLYYLLLYEDTRLTNSSAFIAAGKRVVSYSAEFMSELPIKYLLQQAQKDQSSYAGLFSSLLRLLATHFPHLSLVEDWLDDDTIIIDGIKDIVPNTTFLRQTIFEAFEVINTYPSRTGRLLKKLLTMNPTDVWPHADLITGYFKKILNEGVPKYVQDLYKQCWLQLNTVLPRSLWVMTINALLPKENHSISLTQENIAIDPLQVLRCDQRIFRCASGLTIILRVLQASLAASRCQLARHMLDTPLTERTGQLTSENEREELRLALVSAQESLAVQILLESCLETEEDRTKPGQLLALREVRSLICSYLHQVFIRDPALAKLVHFQGYPRELLPITVQGIPSMHICLDFIPELLSQPSLEKQVFAVDLVSHLSVQYALPKSLSVARLAINTLSTLLLVLPSETRPSLFAPLLTSLVRICEAFPPLAEDTISLLMQLGRVCVSQASLGDPIDLCKSDDMFCSTEDYNSELMSVNEFLCLQVQKTFKQIVEKSVFKVKIY
ncbi:UNVERIFIED_CONTAM: hypothetical protein PYX00_008909 [Menopon gallinae]|uniref:Integrator complex subunit 2 n=1 Tax=Menopon gallinae TaxID=328185 RepID=A0AAW2H927_9NEOP